jgi:hypothetical protein
MSNTQLSLQINFSMRLQGVFLCCILHWAVSLAGSQEVVSKCYFDDFERSGHNLFFSMKQRFSEERARTLKSQHRHGFNRTWAPNDLCEITRNLIGVVKSLTLKAPKGFRKAMVNHLPALLSSDSSESGSDIVSMTLGQVIFRTFLDLLDYPSLEPIKRADVCPAPLSEAKGTILWWLSGRDTKAPLLIKLALAAIDAERAGWTLVVVYSDDAESLVNVLIESLPTRCRSLGDAVTTVSLSSLHVPQPPTLEDHNCVQFSQFYYELSTTEHIIVAGGDDVVVRRPLLPSEYTYAFMGAPWAWCARREYPDWCKFGGNGGFSYRSKSFTIRHGFEANPKNNLTAWKAACETMSVHDDSMWAQELAKLGNDTNGSRWKRAEPEIQAEFSVETVRHSNNPCGMHKTWKYLGNGMDSTYISQLLVAPAFALGKFGYFRNISTSDTALNAIPKNIRWGGSSKEYLAARLRARAAMPTSTAG